MFALHFKFILHFFIFSYCKNINSKSSVCLNTDVCLKYTPYKCVSHYKHICMNTNHKHFPQIFKNFNKFYSSHFTKSSWTFSGREVCPQEWDVSLHKQRWDFRSSIQYHPLILYNKESSDSVASIFSIVPWGKNQNWLEISIHPLAQESIHVPWWSDSLEVQ